MASGPLKHNLVCALKMCVFEREKGKNFFRKKFSSGSFCAKSRRNDSHNPWQEGRDDTSAKDCSGLGGGEITCLMDKRTKKIAFSGQHIYKPYPDRTEAGNQPISLATRRSDVVYSSRT
ncbi:hypothetical protein AVEN_66358-1 [Araneus ventricosus]|uniref:Uncharacterized protein n=1 Tax=Araneus ventricosus TaxID=182803 RepID=A0A4Y2VX96_ARAVE|nr:hypothetical protein AVEN_66358-1 [Araneus ventricosus]